MSAKNKNFSPAIEIENSGELLFKIMKKDESFLNKVALTLLRENAFTVDDNDLTLVKAMLLLVLNDCPIEDYKLESIELITSLATTRKGMYPDWMTALDMLYKESKEGFVYDVNLKEWVAKETCFNPWSPWVLAYGRFLELDIEAQNKSTAYVRRQVLRNKYNPTFPVLTSVLLADWFEAHDETTITSVINEELL